jgi:hypothetical protein
MKTNIKIIKKRSYSLPQIVKIKLDNEISLALESVKPDGEPTLTSQVPEYFNNDPFKTIA